MKEHNFFDRFFTVIGTYFLAMFFLRWFYIFMGIDFKPDMEIEKKAIEYFKKLRERGKK